MRRKLNWCCLLSLAAYCAIYISGRAFGYLILERNKLYAGMWAEEPGQWFGRERNKLFNASAIPTAPLLPLAALETFFFGQSGIGKTKTSDVHIRQRLSKSSLIPLSRKIGLQPIVGFYETRWDQDMISSEWLMRVPSGSDIQERLPRMAADYGWSDRPLAKLVPHQKTIGVEGYTFGPDALTCGDSNEDGSEDCTFIYDPRQQLLYFCYVRFY